MTVTLSATFPSMHKISTSVDTDTFQVAVESAISDPFLVSFSLKSTMF